MADQENVISYLKNNKTKKMTRGTKSSRSSSYSEPELSALDQTTTKRRQHKRQQGKKKSTAVSAPKPPRQEEK